MNQAVTNNLSQEKIQQLLSAIGVESKEDTKDNIDASEYDWQQSRYFSCDQLKEIDDFAGKVAQVCAEKFTQLYHNDLEVTATSATQHFADKLLEHTSKDESSYSIIINTDQDQPFGIINIPTKTAITWTTQLLGGSSSDEDADRNLSQLEESLLWDIASNITEAFSSFYDYCALHPAENIVRNQLPMQVEDTDELCKITFNAKKAEAENSSETYSFIIPCNKLEPIAGKNTEAKNELSAEDISKAMLGHVQQVPLSVTAQLASIMITFEELINLEVDDILLLDKSVNEPVKLILEDRVILRGHLAKSEGKYAVAITELCGTK